MYLFGHSRKISGHVHSINLKFERVEMIYFIIVEVHLPVRLVFPTSTLSYAAEV